MMKKLWNMIKLSWMLGGGPVVALISLTIFSWKISVAIFGVWMLVWIWALCKIAGESSEEVKKYLES